MAKLKTLSDLLGRCVRAPSGCLEFSGCRNKQGYGGVRFGGKVRKAHRVSYTLSKGTIPEGFDICHKCDNPPCCNPDHLWAGPTIENIHDMEQKGRGKHPIGSNHKRSKLVESDIELVFYLRRAGMGLQKLANFFQVGQTTMGHVLSRDTWKYVNVEAYCG